MRQVRSGLRKSNIDIMIYHFEVKSGSTVAPPKPTGSAFSISPQKD
jgi:hypothetical protein